MVSLLLHGGSCCCIAAKAVGWSCGHGLRLPEAQRCQPFAPHWDGDALWSPAPAQSGEWVDKRGKELVGGGERQAGIVPKALGGGNEDVNHQNWRGMGHKAKIKRYYNL